MDDVANGEFDELAAACARDGGGLQYLGRDVPRAGVGAQLRPDAALQRRVQRQPIAQDDEQDDADAALPLLPYRQRFDDLGQPFDLAVDLRRADADAAGVQHRIGAPVDDEPAGFGGLGVVAVAPHAGEACEIGGAVANAAAVAPEPDRHGRERLGAYELAFLAGRGRRAGVGPDLGRHAERRALQLAAADRQRRIAERETAHDVGPA